MFNTVLNKISILKKAKTTFVRVCVCVEKKYKIKKDPAGRNNKAEMLRWQFERRRITGGQSDTERWYSHNFPILACREAGGRSLRGLVVPSRLTLPALISLNNQSVRPRSAREGRLRKLSRENESSGVTLWMLRKPLQPAAQSHGRSKCSGALVNGFKAASFVPPWPRA